MNVTQDCLRLRPPSRRPWPLRRLRQQLLQLRDPPLEALQLILGCTVEPLLLVVGMLLAQVCDHPTPAAIPATSGRSVSRNFPC